MAKMGKKYVASAELIDKSKLYDTNEAIGLVCQTAKAKFDETVEIHIRLALTLVTLTSRLEALSSSPTVLVRLLEPSYSHVVIRQRLLSQPALTT